MAVTGIKTTFQLPVFTAEHPFIVLPLSSLSFLNACWLPECSSQYWLAVVLDMQNTVLQLRVA